MPLTAGSRVGPYEILAPLGAGGMGEVYRARDPRLNRDVALKALPDQFSVDGERIERFRREAQLLAALNHPHIAAIYGLEETNGAQFILLELVEGGTLADRLTAGGALPMRDALRIARDVADAIAAAHDKGIVHRDLKPGNIALTRDGRPKVLDFGLAKAFASEDADAATRPAATRSGAVLGTVPYMSPEQTRGQPADKRSDIWSFGCLLYEMLTGRSPFGGRSSSDVVVSILERDPDFGALPAATPPRVRWLLRRCLHKDPDRRLHDIANARIELDEALSGSDPGGDLSTTSSIPRTGRPARERVAWLVALLSLALLAVALALPRRGEVTNATTDLYRASIVLPDDLRLAALEPAARFAVSPDGRRLAIVASNVTGVPMLWVRSFDSLIAQPLPGTEWASYPFWSPDSRSIAFVAGYFDGTLVANAKGRLRRVDLAGGQLLTLADNALGATGAWGRDDVILFTPSGTSPLHKVSAKGGGSVAASTLDETNGEVQHSYPVFLPDGRHYLYKVLGSRGSATESRGLFVGSLAGDPPRRLLERVSNARVANGHLLFVRESTLFAQRFDPDAIALRGEPVALAERVQVSGTGSEITAAFGVSDTGTLVYQSGLLMRSQLAWLDRSGRTIAPVGGPADFAEVALAPDGSRAAVSEMDAQLGTRDVVIVDVQRGVRERFTSDPSDDFAPVWSPTGDRIAFTSVREGRVEIYERPFNGSGRERKLAASGSLLGKFAASWSPDGSSVLFVAGGRVLARSDIHVTDVDAGGATTPVLENGSVETHPRFSPDGGWVAYSDNDSGEMQVYVRRFRGGGGEKLRVSVSGGGWPRWRADGRELFFLSPGGELMAVAMTTDGDKLKIGNPQPLFKVRLRPMGRLDAYPYDVTKDGERFLCNLFVDEATSAGLTLIVNWPAALR